MKEDLLPKIKALISEIIDLSKDWYNNEKGKRPEYWPGYLKAIDNYEEILPHAQFGKFPEKLFRERAPNQDVKEYEYMKANYQSITLPVFNDVLSTYGSAWNYMNWDIQFGEDAPKYGDDKFSTYLYKGYPKFGNFDQYFQSIILPMRMKDAEAVVAVRPKEMPYKDNGNGELTIDENELLEPFAYIFRCDQIVHKSEELYILESDENSEVEYHSKKQKKGRIFEIYTKNEIIFARQIGKLIDYEFEYTTYFVHNAGKVPVVSVGGIPSLYDGKLIYESRFLHAVGNLNLVLLDASYLFASKTKTAFPVRVMVGKPCDFKDDMGNQCFNGIISVYDEHSEKVHTRSCAKCNGSGLQNRISPTGELMWDPADAEIAQQNGYKMLTYEAPDVTTLQFLQDQIDSNEDKARGILHLAKSNDKAGIDSESATMTNVENKTKMSIIKGNADQEFDLYETLLDIIGFQRYGEDFNSPEITRPITFDFTTEEDYLAMISSAVESGAPPAVVRMIMIKYLRAVYFDNEIQGNVFALLISADRLLDMSKDEIQFRIAQGHIAPWEDLLHVSGITLIDELLREDPSFFDKKIEDQIVSLQDLAKERFKEVNSSEDVVNRILDGNIPGITQ